MKIKGTKKLLIIFFALACALAAGIGVFLTRPAMKGTVAYAASDEHTLPMAVGEKASDATSAADMEALAAMSEASGLAPELISFYARSNGSTEKELYDAYQIDSLKVQTDILNFTNMYSNREIEPEADIVDEDWYIAPDQISSYAGTYTGWGFGLQDTWGSYYTSKDMMTKEAQYFRNSSFQMGTYVKWYQSPAWHAPKYNFIIYSIAWLEEGESFTFGFKSLRAMNGMLPEYMSSAAFLSTYIKGWYFSGGATPPANPATSNDPDTTRNHFDDYMDEFGSTIAPTDKSITSSLSTAANTDQRLTVLPDAPSGAYMITARASANNSETNGSNKFLRWNMGSENWRFYTNKYNPGNGTGWAGYSAFCTYAVLVCRKGVTKPELEYNEGVNTELTAKTVEFDNKEHELIIKGDWGPGLMDYQISEKDADGNWVPTTNKNTDSANVKKSSRIARGSFTKVVSGKTVALDKTERLLKFKATNVGEYKIDIMPFRNWKDANGNNDEDDRDPVSFLFTITPQEVDSPYIIDDGNGVDNNNNLKYVFRTGETQFINIYPVPKDWAKYTATSKNGNELSQFNWSSNGVLALSQDAQDEYKITVSLKYNTDGQINQCWDDGTTAPKTFTFEIGPMKVTVPDIIKEAGESGITKFEKRVTFNGAYQTMSFMPADADQLNINVINKTTGMGCAKDPIKDSTFTFTALDAGYYEMTVSVKDEYVFDDAALNTTLTYVLIIDEMPIDAPRLNEPGITGTTKTVTYGGEKMPDGLEDWVATLSFANADQSRISWKSNTLSQQSWSDSDLVLAGRSAKTYDVTFVPNKNYKWKEGVVVPTYTLKIEKLKIADPQLVQNDGDTSATGIEFTKNSKTVRFDGSSHPFKLYFPTLDSLKNIIYTKASSVEIEYNGTFDRAWDGDYVTYRTTSAGEYSFEVFPTQNYCWSDGSSGNRIFNFIIQPIDIKALDFYATNQWGTGITQYKWTEALGGFHAILNYDGQPKTVRIGNPDAKDDSGRYVLTGDYAKKFYILDENGGYVNRTDENLTGTAAKLLPGMTCSEGEGFLTLTMTTAGEYRIGVILNNPNFWWTETMETMVVYTLTINPEGVPFPTIEQNKCEGNDISGHFGTDSMHGIYYDVNFALAVSLDDQKYKDYIEVTAPDGKIFKFNDGRLDAVIVSELEAALKEKHGVYTDWYDGTMYFYAKDQGEYTWTIKITSPNHAWSGKTSKEITFTIIIDRSPVSGLEMHYVGDTKENMNVLVQDATNIRGGDANAQTVKYVGPVFSEEGKVFFFKRTDTRYLVDTGLSVQFAYTVNKFVKDSNYDDEDMVDVTEIAFNDEELRLSAFDAGTYEIIITPTDNYCWNDPGKTTGSIKFTLVIDKLTIDTPLVILDDGSTTTTGVKDAEFNHKFLTMQLDLLDYPKGYKIQEFEYVSTDKAAREEEGEELEVKISGKSTLINQEGEELGEIKLGVDADTGRMSVQAKSAGEYLLTVVVSNVNNYQLAGGDQLGYRFNIARKSVSLPNAYLDKVHLTEENAGKLTQTDSDVRTYAGTENAEAPNSENIFRTKFDSYYHSVYLYGDDIELGDFKIIVTGETENGMEEKKEFQPDALYPDTEDKIGYYRLSVFGVNTYTITLKFVTRDFYWDKDISSSGEERIYKLIVTSKLIKVPTIRGYEQSTLIDNRYTAEIPYVKDDGKPGNTSHVMITLDNVEFGVVVSDTPATTYAIINSKISESSTEGGVLLDNYPQSIDDTYGTITMRTAIDGEPGEAKVTYTYVIELNIDPNNMRWEGSGEGDALTKYYEIKITKQKVDRPYIIDTVDSTGDEKYVTYTGADWAEALKIANINKALIKTVLSDTVKMKDDHVADYSEDIKNVLLVSTDPEADTYTVTAKLIDPDNSEWKDGTVDDIVFSLIVEKMRVEKPYIYIPDGKTEAQEGVVGRTKTATYENDPEVVEHIMKIGNYWADLATVKAAAAEEDRDSITYVPEIMSYTVTNGEGKLKTKGEYKNEAKLTDDKFKDYFTNGLLVFGAEKADRYIVSFKLSKNAKWSDGSEDDVDVILIINKKVHENMFILDGETDTVSGDKEWCDEISGNTKTYTYNLDDKGNPVVAFMQIGNYVRGLVRYNGITKGKSFDADGDGYLEYHDSSISDPDGSDVLGVIKGTNSVRVIAYNAGEYEIQFQLEDAENHRWEASDSHTCEFTLKIKKLQLFQPVINTDYSLTNESFEGNTLTVDYDKNLHTILVESLFGKLNNGYYGDKIGESSAIIGEKYFSVNNSTYDKSDDPKYEAGHKTYYTAYDYMLEGDTKIRELFEDTSVFDDKLVNPAYKYKGEHADDFATVIDVENKLINLFRLTAYTPGNYFLTFKLADKNNMEWAGSSSDEVEFKIVINKVIHAAPVFAGSTLLTQTKEYTGDKVEFTFNNVYNGVMTEGGEVTGTESETYKILSYEGNDKDLSEKIKEANEKDDFSGIDFEIKWFNGALVLGFTEVGTYKVKISITDTNYIGWEEGGTSKTFECVVSKCTVTADVTFTAPNDSELDAKLRDKEQKDIWYVTVDGGVFAEIVLKGLRDVPDADKWDQRLEFKVYYARVKDSTELGEMGLVSYSDKGGLFSSPFQLTEAEKQPDGSYNMTIWYQEIGNGKGKIRKGEYCLYIVQIDEDGNHKLAIDPVPFEIEADPAPFKTDMLEWVFTRSDDKEGDLPISVGDLGQTEDNPFILDFEEGVSFTFIPQLKTSYRDKDGKIVNCQDGYEGKLKGSSFIEQLKSYYVIWDGTYDGEKQAKKAGENYVSITIKANEPNEYSFPDFEFKLYYKINKARYNLSDLEWYYDASIAKGSFLYEYDGANKEVKVVAKKDTTMPEGLTPNKYETEGYYVSLNTPDEQTDITKASTNVMQNAGYYTTTLLSFTNSNDNYETPDKDNPDSYLGTFVWTRTWTIKPQHIVVDWVQGQTTSSNGDKVTRSQPKVAGEHSTMFGYDYELLVSTDPEDVWEDAEFITRIPGETLIYKATAYLKSGTGATDYARNYTFEFEGGDDPDAGNPLVFPVGGNDTVIYNTITVDKKIQDDYEYTGKPFKAETEIDFDTSNGQITVEDNIYIYYYKRNAKGEPIGDAIDAPTEIGNYIVVLKLHYEETTEDFTLSEQTFPFNIVTAKLSAKNFEWHIKHNDGTTSFEAKFDTSLDEKGKWIDIATNKEVTIDYDGKEYEVYLYTKYDASIIKFEMVDSSAIKAGEYKTTAIPDIDEDHYEFNPKSKPSMEFEWEIKKHTLDFKDVAWDYEKPFVFTVVNGSAKAFSVAIKNLPAYLLDKVEYTVYRNGELIDGDLTDWGNYKTTIKILENKIDKDNYDYDLTKWPAKVKKTLDWEIQRREMSVPKDDASWAEFDGVQHNLLKPFKFDVDWAEYFDVEVTYQDFNGKESSYDGTAYYGNKYYAYNAGTYIFDFIIKQKFNKDDMNNIVWRVEGEDDVTHSVVTDQKAEYTVAKKDLVVTKWEEGKRELSYVKLQGNIDSTKFIDYKFYWGVNGAAGEAATLNDVLQSAGKDKFSMVPEIRSVYSGNMTLAFESKDLEFIWFETPEITEDNASKVGSKPYIYAYTVNGKTFPFSNEQIASGDLSVTYTGEDITFKIFNWDDHFSKYVTTYGCSLNDLTQREANEYTLTLVLRSDLEKPLYWGKTEDNKIDRSEVKLMFKIIYKMLTIPELPSEITYNGTEINILEKATNSTYKKLLEEYGEYVTITNNTATNFGEQTLYLSIKEEYGNAVRWNNGEEQGIVGTYSFVWKITRVLIQKPEVNTDARIEYDGQAHSVYEILKGYDEKKPTPEISKLMENINETGGRGVYADTYNAVLSLPNDNYAWCDKDGKELSDRSSVEIEWKIAKKNIDFGNAFWGYMDGEEEVKYDPDKPFVFTLVNGKPKNFTVEILGMPEILKICTSYSTNGGDGNSAGAVGTYTTTVVFDLDKLDRKNYEVGTVSDSILELVWKIVPREIALPESDGSWTEFDGKVHSLTALVGLPEDWAEYLDVTVEYRETSAVGFAPYKGADDFVVGFSNYTGFYYGYYKLSVAIRYDATITSANVKWAGGVAPEDIVIEVSELNINVTGWFENDEDSYVLLEGGKILSEEISDRLEYRLYEEGDLTQKLLKPEDVVGGKTYCLEYAIKSGNDAKGIAYNYGIILSFAKGVPNPLEFGTGDYGTQSIFWLPAPVLETAVLEYNGEAQTFVIKDFDAYNLSWGKKNWLYQMHSIELGDDVTSYVYLQTKDALTATSAGTYTAVVRLLSKVRLSWYDPEIYSTIAPNSTSNTLIFKDSGLPVPNAESLFNNKSYLLNYTITPKAVPALTDEDLEKLMGIIVVYDGTEKDVTVEAKEVFDELEAKYGKIFEYAGNKGTAAKEYELKITLADLGSSFFYVGEPTEKEVKYDGYEFKYVADGSGWKLVLVKVDDKGNAEIDSAGNLIEFNNGDYKTEVAYLPKFKTQFVKIRQDEDHPNLDLINADGTVNINQNYFLDKDGERIEFNGGFVTYTYEMNEADNTKVVRYGYNEDSKEYYPTNDPTVGIFVKRIELDLNADPKYGYKVTETEDMTEYTYLFNKLEIVDGDPVAATDGKGNYIDTYLFFNGTDYELRKYTLNADGSFVPDGSDHYVFTPVEAQCQFVDGDESYYKLTDGTFVADSDGEYMYRYVLDGNDKKQQIVYAKDKDGNLIVDTQYTVVTKPEYEKVTDAEYKVKWEISSAILPMPELDEEKVQQYTGGKLYAKDVLKGFLPDLMEIVDGGEAVEAGEHTARIVLTTTNSKWNPNDTTENYVIVTWRIDKAKIDFSEVKLVYTDGTNTYEDCSDLVYTRKDGKPVVYWIELANLPEALKGKVIYNTNGIPGAYAGTDAGKYETTIDFKHDSENIEDFTKPEEFNEPITWYIKRRTLDVPEIGSVFMVFDSEEHNLLDLLGVPEYWNEYYNITVQYAANFVDYTSYNGHEGNKYVAFGSGAYKFTFSIKTGINTTVTNPNVVWAKNSDLPEPPEESGEPGDTGDDGSTDVQQAPDATESLSAKADRELLEAPAAVTTFSAETEEPVTEVKSVKAESNLAEREKNEVPAQEVCDRLKELAFCAESQTKSFRKYSICTRGTV